MYLLLLFFVELLFLFFLSRKVTKGLGTFTFRITKSNKWTVYIMSVLFLPGTFIHEMAHFLSALILLVPVRQIELTPEVKEGKVSLGRVPIAKVDFVRRTIVGISPLILGTFLILGIIFYITSKGLLTAPLYTVLAGYLVFEVGNTMYLSKKDLEGVWVFFLLIFILLLSLYLLGVRISATDEFYGVVKTANLYLLVPIIIDLFFLFILSLFPRYN